MVNCKQSLFNMKSIAYIYSTMIDPCLLHTKLSQKYSSSQTYFYLNKIKQIVKERRTAVNIFYEDVEYLLDQEQNLKRWYQAKEISGKMFSFKEYYYYHYDCPRIFVKDIQDIIAKWQDRKRDYLYKKLKLIYNESIESSSSTVVEEQKSKNFIEKSHLLLEISDYNPYSKKYYLRVQANKEKDRKRYEQERKKNSKRDIQFLNNELSAMLGNMSQLSDISMLSVIETEPMEHYTSTNESSTLRKSQQKSRNSSLTKTNSLIKFNFKKTKQSVEKLLAPNLKKLSLREPSKEKEAQQLQLSPKFFTNQIDNQFLKSKSIFSVSSFGVLNKKTDIRQISKQQEIRTIQGSKKLTIDGRKYETEKKKDSGELRSNIIKTKSTSKIQLRVSQQKGKRKQGSLEGKLKADEFSDKKLAENKGEFRLRSMKSEYLTNKLSILNLKPSQQFIAGKRTLSIKS